MGQIFNSRKHTSHSNNNIHNKRINYKPLGLAIAVALTGTLPTIAFAETYMVSNTADSGAGSLREAIDFANGTTNVADTIEFDTTLVPAGSTITLNSTLPTITDTLSIAGPTAGDASSIVLDGTNAHRQIKAEFSYGSGKSLSLENITLKNGLYTTTNSGYSVGGGAIFVKYADLTLNNSHILNNSTSGSYARGGGVFVYGGSATLNQSTISGNSTTGTEAGGGGVFVNNGSVTLNQSTISDNSTIGSNADGGGLRVYRGDIVKLTESTISGNTTTGANANGGGIFANTDITLTQSTVSGNSVAGTNADGGGIFMSSSTFTSNIATISQSSVVSNQSANGAAGLSINYEGRLSLTNSILADNNNTGTGSGNLQAGGDVAAYHSFFGDAGTEINHPLSSNNIVNNNNPSLGPLLDNGGPTLTHLPNIGSPVLNMGDNASTIATDQRGTSFNRIIDTTVDIGAVELQTTRPSVVTNTNDSGAGSLRQAVLYANSSLATESITFDSGLTNQTITLQSELVITDSLTISGPTAGIPASLTLDANGNSRHINGVLSSSGETITLENITLQNGKTTGPSDEGGAVNVRNADLVLNHALVTNNSTIGNYARGGGLSINSGNLTLNQSTLSGNSTTGFFAQAGGIYVFSGNATLNQSTVSSNSTTGLRANNGGLYVRRGDAILNQSTVTHNSTNGSGGGLKLESGSVTLNQSTVTHNFANIGGGISLYSGNATLTQSTFANNSSISGGAGLDIYTDSEALTFTLLNTIFSGNNNALNDLPEDLRYYSFGNATFNVNATNSLLSTNVEPQVNGTNTANIINDNPGLGPLQNNGGRTETHLPNSTSDALDAGSNTIASNAGFTFDQRGSGYTRIQFATVDIGAVESSEVRNQTISFTPPTNKIFGDAAFTVAATASSGLTVSLASTTPTICSISGNSVSLLGVGSCTIKATQGGSFFYNTAPDVSATIIVAKAPQTINFTSPSGITFGDAVFALNATGGDSGNPVIFSSNSADVCTINGSNVTIIGAGTCAITASQAGNANFDAATVNVNLSIAKADQTISFIPPTNKTFGDAPFTVSATSSSGLAVSFSSSTSSVCSVSGSTVTLLSAGTCNLRADQAGNANFKAAPQISANITGNTISQNISFTPPSNKTFGDAPFALSATGGASGNAVTFTSNTVDVCTVNGEMLTIVSAGTCSINANQAGNSNFDVAPQISANIEVARADQSISFTPPSNKALSDGAFAISATASSGLAVSFNSTTPNVCTVSGATISLIDIGSCSITASQLGNANFKPASEVTGNITIENQASTFTFDIDDNGEIKALSDGLLVLRNLFGFTGDALIAGAIGSDANRNTASEIEAYLQAAKDNLDLDIDGNGEVTALTDGLLLLRYQFGFRGTSLIQGAIGDNATRDTADAIEAFLE